MFTVRNEKKTKRTSRRGMTLAKQRSSLWCDLVNDEEREGNAIPALWIDMVWNRRVEYWANRFSICSFAHTTHSFTCSALLALHALRCAHWFARSLTHTLRSSRESDLCLWIECVEFIRVQPTVHCALVRLGSKLDWGWWAHDQDIEAVMTNFSYFSGGFRWGTIHLLRRLFTLLR